MHTSATEASDGSGSTFDGAASCTCARSAHIRVSVHRFDHCDAASSPEFAQAVRDLAAVLRIPAFDEPVRLLQASRRAFFSALCHACLGFAPAHAVVPALRRVARYWHRHALIHSSSCCDHFTIARDSKSQ